MPHQGDVPSSDLPPDAQTLSDCDQTAADRDQTESDLDQTAEDSDQAASERDQAASDRDQAAADDDQRASDRAGANREGYARTRRTRLRGALERDETSRTRSDTAHIRDEAALRRDRIAAERDAAARNRDRLAAALDREIERLEGESHDDGRPMLGIDVLLRAAEARKDAAASRARSAKQREAAAEDRAGAARDRRQAALDRAAAAEELALEGPDRLTGALGRRQGLAAMQREMDRTARTGESLVVAFVDVEGLRPINGAQGPAAGDRILRETVLSIGEHLRSYDMITRFGGGEFVCSLAGQDIAGVRRRFAEISGEHAAAGRAPFTVGFAERREGDTLSGLIDRADIAMAEARHRQHRGKGQ